MKKTAILTGIILLLIGYIVGSKLNPTSESTNQKEVETESEVQATFASSSAADSSKREIAAINPYNDTEEATIELFKKSAPSVVSINTSSLRQSAWTLDITEMPKGSGTGFIWDDSGHIVTNFHVIEGGDRFVVTLADRSSYDASVVGVEPSKDLAILKIITPGVRLRPIPVGRSANLKIGQSVYAIGNPFGLDQSLTTGIISALGREIKAQNGRPIQDVIQTDAAINPGNSGGPLLDSSGRLIGVNTAIYSPSGASAGIGFSIPVDVVNWVVPDIISYGEVRRPIMGIELVPVQYYDGQGAMIRTVGEGTPAKNAGLKGLVRDSSGRLIAGDVITRIDNTEVNSNNDLILALEKYAIGDEINIEFVRSEKKLETNLRLTTSIRN